MGPLLFRPIIKRIRWGGRRLGDVLAKPIGNESDYAESWEISDHGEDQSVVVEGPLAGTTLHELVTNHADELFGEQSFDRDQFPLLVKFLDASDRLSVQVHPNDALARTYQQDENGKTEAWVILDADRDSRLYVGLKEGIDAATLQEHIRSETLEECLHTIAVKPGDCVFVPAGTVHAIGEGILLAEIQQSSDLTFRLYDWGRVGTDGKPRQLHIEDALKCIDFERGPVEPVEPRRLPAGIPAEELVHCPYFCIRRYRGEGAFQVPEDGRFHVFMVIGGEARLEWDHESTGLLLGQTALLPAVRQSTRLHLPADAIVLDAFVP
ncbi:Putative mannose-6-phosphate isomerase YvyI [Maioricimonas rarisocia]|uniref:Mannose-6-phosphate isomerase YvyI n=1 Tax=Maioricimonas rarisocia TaxID=2528026 RepID=A0A517Z4Q2_9PLAN|nr:type I phosphomannose isomerase catalytic subunit [Maioricimonas rarisocia]QDU37454.1 Putative mannose-6-phosphate isomerase YvyI [Maioricimonas rarisocia]